MTDQPSNQTTPESWAIVELMGHVAIAGRVTKPGEYGGLWQIDIPTGDTFRTEFFGSQSVYRIRMVSEEIARAYAPRHQVLEYAAPIVTREEHESAMQRMREKVIEAVDQVQKLRIQLGTGNALPAGSPYEDDHDPTDDEDDAPF